MNRKLVLGLMIILGVSNGHAQGDLDPFCVGGLNSLVVNRNWSIPIEIFSELGTSCVRRYNVRWYSVAPEDFDFTKADNWADFAAANGVVPVIDFQCVQGFPDTSINADTTGWKFCERMNWENFHDDSKFDENDASWFPQDTTLWKRFLQAFVERYDGDGVDDYPGLVKPFRVYQLEGELPRVWCKETEHWDEDYIRYANLSYDAIKAADPNAIVKTAGQQSFDFFFLFAGFIKVDSVASPLGGKISLDSLITLLEKNVQFQKNNARFINIMSNAKTDVLDIHAYGRAEWLPERAAALKGLFGDKLLWTLEGGGPFRAVGEIFNDANDQGLLSPELLEENAAYVIRYYIGGLGSGFSRMAWKITPQYDIWGQTFGDIALLDIDNNKKPSYWTYAGLNALVGDFISIHPVPDSLYWQNPDIVGYECIKPAKTLTFIWNLEETARVSLQGVERQHIFPTEMGQTTWQVLSFPPEEIVNFDVGRIPVILEGNLQPGDSTLTSVEEIPGQVPDNFQLLQNYPNPFNPATTISYRLPRSSHVVLTIYNTRGQMVDKLVDSQQAAGNYSITWRGSNSRGEPVSSGIYLYKLQTPDFTKTRKMLLLR